MKTYYVHMENLMYIFVFYCGCMRSVYVVLLVMLFATFFNDFGAYLKPITAIEVVLKILWWLVFVVGIFSAVTSVDYMSRLH